MIFIHLVLLVHSMNLELITSNDHKYCLKQSLGGQSLELQISFDTNLLMVIDTAAGTKNPSYNGASSSSFQAITANSELCWSMIQTSSEECLFSYKSELNNTIEGVLSLETVIFGTSTLKELIFGRILKQSSDIQTSGIIGLGPSNLDALYGTSLIETVISNQGIRAVVGLCFKDEKGKMHLGGYDSAYAYEDFSIYPVVYNNRYSVVISSIVLKDIEILMDLEGRLNPAVPYLYLPYNVIIKLIQAMKEFYGESCKQALCDVDGHVFFGNSIIRPPASFPDISIDLQGFKVTLRGFLRKCNIDQYCSIIRSGGEYGIIGTPILEQVYLVIDMENSKLAMSPLKKCQDSDHLVLLNSFEQSPVLILAKIFMMISALAMIIVIGWRCGKSYELEFEIISGDDD